MRNLLFYLVILSFSSCKSGVLHISFDNNYSGKVYLYNTKTKTTDTLGVVKNSLFYKSRSLENPTLYFLVIDGINSLNRPFNVVLSNDKTEVQFNDLIPIKYNSQNITEIYPNKPHFIKDPNNNNEYYSFQEIWIDFYINIINPQLSFDERRTMHTAFVNSVEEIIKRNADKLISAVIIDELMKGNLIQIEKIQHFYSHLSDEIKNTSIGEQIADEAGFIAQTRAPEFVLHDYTKHTYSLNDFKGKKVLLHFWSSTCAPCFDEIPQLIELTENNADLVVVNISLDTDSTRWVEAMNRMGMTNMINYCGFKANRGDIAKKYHINAIPANYLIDEEGSIITKTEKIDKLLKYL